MFHAAAGFEPASPHSRAIALHFLDLFAATGRRGALWVVFLSAWEWGCSSPASGTRSHFSPPAGAAQWKGSGCILLTSASPRGREDQARVMLHFSVLSEATGAAAPARSRPVGKSGVCCPRDGLVAAASG